LGNKKYRKNTKWIIYKIKRKVDLYKDTRYDNGYYTMDNIDPSNISVVEYEN
jgi:hypothetical protein